MVLLRPFGALLMLVALSASCGKESPDKSIARGDAFAKQNLTAEAIVQYKLALQADPNRADAHSRLAEQLLKNRQGGAAVREAVLAADLLSHDAKVQVRAGTLLLYAGSFEDAKSRADKALAIDPSNVDALVLKGNALAGLKEFDSALEEFQEAIAIQPAGDNLYVGAGAVQYARGDRKSAEESLRKAVSVAPSSPSTRVALAGFLWAAGRLPEAEKVLEEALALDARNASANRALGLLYATTGRVTEAEPYFRSLADNSSTDGPKLALADYYLSLGKSDAAKPVLTELARKPAMFEAATLRLAAIEVTSKNLAGAQTLVDSVLLKNPNFTPARVLRMRLMGAQGRSDDVMSLAAGIVKDEPNTIFAGQAEFAMGVVEAARDRMEEAETHLNEALRLVPKSPNIVLALAQLHLRAGRFDKAESFAQQLIGLQPGDPEARFVIVRSRLARKDEKGAAAELASLQREYPNAVAVLNLTGAQSLAAGRFEQARALYTRAAEADPDNLEALDGLLAIDLQMKRHGDAIARAETALTRIPKSADLLFLVGKTYMAAGELSRAERPLLEAIESEPNRFAAYGLLSQIYLQQKRLPEARGKLEAMLQKNPRSVSVNTMLGTVLDLMNDPTGAERQYQRAIALDPEAAVAANNLAWHYVVSNRNLDQALQFAQTAYRQLPEDSHINDTLGWAYYHKEMYAQAVRHLEQGVSHNPKDPGMQYRLGMAYFRAGQDRNAKKALKTALSLSASFDGATQARKTLAQLGGQ